VKKENELTLQQAEMRMMRWMCGVKITDRFICSELTERLVIDDIITVIQRHRLRRYGHVLRKDENDWVKKYTDLELNVYEPDPEADQKNSCSISFSMQSPLLRSRLTCSKYHNFFNSCQQTLLNTGFF